MIAALETNAPTTQIPSLKETLTALWSKGTLLAISGLGVSYVVSLASTTWAIITGSVFLLCFLVLSWVTWKSIWAAASMERRVLACGYLLSLALLGASSGLSLDGGINNSLSQQEGVATKDDGTPKWHLEWAFGETNTHLVWASVVTFLGTSGIVFGLNWNRVRTR